MRNVVTLLALVPITLGCVGTLSSSSPPDAPDAGLFERPVVTLDDAGTTPATDAGPIVIVRPDEDDAGPPPAPDPLGLADDLEITGVDLFQAVRVPIVEDRAPADRDELPVIAGRDALVRVHVEALSGWTAREVTAVLELETAEGTVRFEDRRQPTLPSRIDDPTTGFAIDLPGEAIEPGARFRLRLEADDGVAEAPEAIYPAGGAFEALDAEIAPPLVLVLVPFRYDTDGSGRVPDIDATYLERLRQELTSILPYAEAVVRVHDVVPWTQADRYNGNVDWGDVNAELIDIRDDELAPDSEYWYGLVAAATSRSGYCDKTWGSCVTGQAFVAGVNGSRVGSGVGFPDDASIETISHELGHMHGRYHAPCGTSGESGYPHYGGRIGVWGWDRRDGAWHDPDVATDLMGYCSDEWISDYTFRAMHERAQALRGSSIVVAAPPVARRFVTVEDGAARWGEPRMLRRLPGERASGVWLDAAGRSLGAVEIGSLDPAHHDARVWVVPTNAPAGAAAIAIGGEVLALP